MEMGNVCVWSMCIILVFIVCIKWIRRRDNLVLLFDYVNLSSIYMLENM